MSDLGDRRARKKAATREAIRAAARELFYAHGFDTVTIADIAQRSDVAVQTVFNHFATKEELFFDGQTPWVEGAANAVRHRAAGEPPLAALRAYVSDVVGLLSSLVTPERQAYIAAIEGSATLRSYERELVTLSERLLAEALLDAWTAEDCVDGPIDPHTAAPITAAVWLAAARVICVQRRPRTATDPAPDAAAMRDFAERLLGQMESCLDLIHGVPDRLPQRETGWPLPVALRAG